MSLFILILIIIFSLIIGFYQAKFTLVRIVNATQLYYRDNDGTEQKIYTHRTMAKGGLHYLIGWCLILIVQLSVGYLLTNEAFSIDHSFKELYAEVLRDLMSAFRFSDVGNTSWSVWALTGFSSLFYTYFLIKKSPAIKEKLISKDDADFIDEK
ncbi:hypothetical protein [Dellaglioa carnosa]|uniref:Uncharacterized protein n=2 Tax=Dellaglioa algida TaxID=105612 RepID=A0A0R1HQT1_9LACO|nr:hypothetical protein [Dellaglioa carnosa]KRK46084.1 hypothetical protein FC66_GL000585 [Dellaglioa algida DSM 15638]MCZ2492173.1 hypothetical protein [Dellaglioa carnosa]